MVVMMTMLKKPEVSQRRITHTRTRSMIVGPAHTQGSKWAKSCQHFLSWHTRTLCRSSGFGTNKTVMARFWPWIEAFFRKKSLVFQRRFLLAWWRRGVLQRRIKHTRNLSYTTCWSISFRKSTPPQNRQLNISISHSKQYIDDFVEDLTF